MIKKSNEELRVDLKHSEGRKHWEMLLAQTRKASNTRAVVSSESQTQPQHRITHKTPAAMDEAHAARLERWRRARN